MKKTKCLVSIILAAILSMGLFAGCGKKDNSSLGNKYVDVYTAPSTAKIMRTEEKPDYAGSELKISLAGGEAESAQIVMTANDIEISEYSVTASDLKSGENTLAKENIEIYVEHYIRTRVKSNKIHPAGWYPDAIIPYELAKNANELTFKSEPDKNGKVALCNQAIWVTINAPRGQAAGTYTGTITLDVMGSKTEVPVSCKVYAFDINEEIHAMTAFAIWEDRQQIELGYDINYSDGFTQEERDRKAQIVKNEYEFMASKKIAPTNIPLSEYTRGNYAEFAAAAKKYASRPEISAFRIPVNANADRILSAAELTGYLKALLDASIEGNKVTIDLFKKAYCYVAEIDEPHESTHGKDIYQKVDGVNRTIANCKQSVINLMKGSKYKNVEGIDKLIASLDHLPHVVTAERRPGLANGQVQTFCPQVQFYNNRDYFDETEERKVTMKEGAWWYTCVRPVAPYPSYHIDDTLVGARVMGWMQKDYRIEGNLYWCTNIYTKYENSRYLKRDVWNDPLAFPPVNGDGYLTYPGVKYGIDAPIGTIRLDNVRDAQEDYEYLYMLEQLINESNAKYGTDVDFEEVVRSIYDTIYRGVIAFDDPTLVIKAREQVATMIEALTSDDKSIIDVDYSTAEDKFVVKVTAPADADVKVNGTAATKEGNFFVAKVADSDITVSINGKEYVRSMGEHKVLSVIDGDENVNKGGWISAKETETVYDGSAMRITLKAKADASATETADLTLDFDSADLTNADQIVLYVYNDGDEVVKPTISVLDGSNKSNNNDTVAHLYPKTWNRVVIGVKIPKSGKLDGIVKLGVSISPSKTKDINIILDNLYYIAK